MSKSAKTLILGGLLISMVVSIWQFLGPDCALHAAAPASSGGGGRFVVAGCTAVFAAALYAYHGLAALVEKGNAAITASAAHLHAGRFDEAEQAVRPSSESRLVLYRRAGATQSAMIACLRGDRDAALLRVGEALALPPGRVFPARDRAAIVNAHAYAAFLRACADDEAAARVHVAAVRAEVDAEPAALAHAALAEAVLLARRGDRAALRELVDRSRALWFQACPRNERALVRALMAMLDAGSAPVYRQPADGAVAPGERDAAAAWVARMVPIAAPFVRVAPPDAPGAARGAVDAGPEPSAEATRKVAAARPSLEAKNGSGRALAIGVLLVGAFAGAWGSGVPWSVRGAVLLAIGALVAWTGGAIARNRADARRLQAGIRAHGSGDLERASAELAFEPRQAWRRVQAAHLRAEIAIAKGDMQSGLAETDRALAALAEAQGGKVKAPARRAGATMGWDFQRALASQRANALAALGRTDEARAEIRWANGFPNALTELRVALMERLAVHDFQAAARLVEGRDPDLALAARDEVLFDLVRFVARPAARGEGAATRLRADLQRIPHLAAWIDAVAPGLVAAFEAAAAEGEAGGRTAAAT